MPGTDPRRSQLGSTILTTDLHVRWLTFLVLKYLLTHSLLLGKEAKNRHGWVSNPCFEGRNLSHYNCATPMFVNIYGISPFIRWFDHVLFGKNEICALQERTQVYGGKTRETCHHAMKSLGDALDALAYLSHPRNLALL